MRNFFDLLRLLLFLLFLFIHLLDFGFITFLLFVLLLLLVFFTISYLLFLGLLNVKLNGKADEFRMLLHKILQSALLQEFRLVFLQVTDNLSSPLDDTMNLFSVLLYCK